MRPERCFKVFFIIMEKEIFKTIEGYEDYQISNLGKVKSLRCSKEKILKIAKTKTGYNYVVLTYGNGNLKTLYVHRLVAFAFFGKSDKAPCLFRCERGFLINSLPSGNLTISISRLVALISLSL